MAAPKTVELEGQNLALAKLSRIGFICSLTPTNAPLVDIQGFHHLTRRQILVQVKTVREGFDWQMYADEHLIIEKSKQPDGRYFMQVKGQKPLPQQTIFWIFVKLSQTPCEKCSNFLDKSYICTIRDVQDIAERKFTAALTKRNGYRAKGGKSTHFVINEADLTRYKDWSIVSSANSE